MSDIDEQFQHELARTRIHQAQRMMRAMIPHLPESMASGRVMIEYDDSQVMVVEIEIDALVERAPWWKRWLGVGG